MVQKVWRDAVGSKVIAAAIIALIGGIYSYLSGSWSKIDAFLHATQSIPHWVIIITIAPLLLCFLYLIGLIRSGKRLKTTNYTLLYRTLLLSLFETHS